MERLDAEGIKYEYEREAYQIVLDQPGFCRSCGKTSIGRKSRYTPDFFFPIWVIEAKGKFTSRDRKRVVALLEAEPGMKFGMLFMRNNFIRKGSKTRYSQWCESKNIPYAVGWFKDEWLK